MIVIIDYGMGNLGSIANMLKKIGAPAAVSSDPAVIERADKLILPGVGAFDHGMRNLIERGLIPVLNEQVLNRKKTVLGLCLGMQLLTKKSEEGILPGLGWIEAETERFKIDGANAALKIPHMGWNTTHLCQPHWLLAGADAEPRFYFVHSYHIACADESIILATTRYGYDFASIVAKDNIAGVQFHPEKSHWFGMQLLRNFAEGSPSGTERA
jgi:imidazole glycerol-phosphate synthase subunit HisH